MMVQLRKTKKRRCWQGFAVGKEHKSAISQSLAPEEAENVVRGKLNPSDNRQQDARKHFTFRFISYHN
jgi:hypothetical protein